MSWGVFWAVFWALALYVSDTRAASLITFATGAGAVAGASVPAPAAPGDCVSCHQQEVALWQASHHAQSMAAASAQQVLGDFADRTFEHKSLRAKLYRHNDEYWMRLQQGGQRAEWQVSHTFGVQPLQQYLTQLPNGRTQVLPLAWDSRLEARGGQRWITLYPEEDITSADRLHWQQPLQNWNGMCADCHSTGLVRNYQPSRNQFSTTFDQVQVSCGSCHRLAPGHGKRPSTKPPDVSKPAVADNLKSPWRRLPGQQTAHRLEPRPSGVMDQCFACHSLRTPLVDGIDPTLPFLDQFMPSLIQQPLYFADGQIREEVYVYGSFLQSKMFDRGVVCQDCHDPHSQALKIEGDGLCAQCHAPGVFANPDHHLHPVQSAGARCVNCHMPATTYMQVDPRRDHGFSIPRPLVSQSINAPDACTRCHQDRTPQWAAQALDKAHPQRQPLSTQSRQVLHGLSGQPLAADVLHQLLADVRVPSIQRASVLANQVQLARQGLTGRSAPGWQPPVTAFSSPEPLLTIAAIAGADLLPVPHRTRLLLPLLKHERKAVRVAATEALLGLQVPATAMADFRQGFIEMTTALEQIAWRGEGAMRRSAALLQQGQSVAAEAEWLRSIEIEPYFVPAYVNLADSYRRRNALDEERTLYNTALARLPEAGVLHHAHSLFFVRQQDYAAASEASERAVSSAPQAVAYATVYVLIMERLGKSREVLGWLLTTMQRYDNDPSLAQLGYALAQKLPDAELAEAFSTILSGAD